LEFNHAFIMFFCGVLAHALGIRIFSLWSKRMVYKTTYISSLAILKMSEGFAKDVMIASGLEDEKDIEATFQIWRAVALNSLNTILSDLAWRSNCIHDWDEAMKTISSLQNKRSARDEV
jgi:hypothetical protein